MSERIIVPLTGANVVPQGDVGAEPVREAWRGGIFEPQSRTSSERSINLARNGLGRTIERDLQRRAQAAAPASTPAPPQPSQSDALQTQISALTEQVQGLVTNMANRQRSQVPQYGGDSQQYGQDEQLYSSPELDPANYDFYDPLSALQYRTAHDAHVKEAVQRAVEADRVTREKAAQGERLHEQLDAADARFKRDANYEDTMKAAIDRAADSGWTLTLEDAYLQVSKETEARSGRRGTSYMPKEIKGLGAIMRYNQATGRVGRTNKKRARW